MNAKEYLVIIEIDRQGFVTQPKKLFKEAEKLSEQVLDFVLRYNVLENGRLNNVFNKKNFISYNIKGNMLYFPKIKTSIGNGVITISIVEINSESFRLQALIKERENYSIVFELEELSEEMLKKFPSINLIAN